MTTSGTYVYNPAVADVFAAAFSMCGVRRPELTVEHIADAGFQANMVMVDFSNRNPNQWALEVQQVPLVAGTNTYSLTNRTIAIAAAYISITIGGTINDRLMAPMSATEYAAIPIKAQQGFPNSYWFNLANPIPQLHLYYTPDSAYTYTLNLTTFRQMQDVVSPNGQTLDAPYRFLDAFTTGLAARLALNYPDQRRPTLSKDLEILYEKRSVIAASQDQEDVNIYVVPGLYSYFR
jgi:hypothetical protein